MKMTMTNYEDGKPIPKWHGIAWTDFETDTLVTMPVPLNRLAAMVRDWWWRLRSANPGWMDAKLLEVRENGYARGWNDCQSASGRLSRLARAKS